MQFLYIYLGFCVGFSLALDLTFNSDCNDKYYIEEKLKWHEILLKLLISPLMIPIFLAINIYDFIYNKYLR